MDVVSMVAGFTQLLRDLGLLGGCVLALYASFKRWWVWGSEFDEIRKDRDEWKTIALRMGGITDRVLNGHGAGSQT